MTEVPADLLSRLRAAGQDHVLFGWDSLDAAARRGLLDQLAAIDLEGLAALYAKRGQKDAVPPVERIKPLPVTEPPDLPPECRAAGEDALRRGEVAVLIVAGGQGSRLGFDHPKGMYPVAPVTKKTLFQIHAEKVLALTRKYGKPVPLLVMTSPATHTETEAFFREHRFFGLPEAEVSFFQQGTMPALDLATGRLLLERPGVLFASPNGHGGTLTALADSGLLAKLKGRGVRHVFYFQVDNPLIRVCDPAFLGHHVRERADVSMKVVYKQAAADKVGVFVLVDGRCSIIEYSDLPDELARATDASGTLVYRAGNPAIHVFDVGFLERVTSGAARLPFHVARKKVPCIDAAGRPVKPEAENALKFEMFVFDALPLADRWTAVSTTRREEFVPLKNATGADSPDDVRQALSNQAGDWLKAAGADVPFDAAGNVAVPLEVSPLAALGPEDLAGRVLTGKPVNGVWSPDSE